MNKPFHFNTKDGKPPIDVVPDETLQNMLNLIRIVIIVGVLSLTYFVMLLNLIRIVIIVGVLLLLLLITVFILVTMWQRRSRNLAQLKNPQWLISPEMMVSNQAQSINGSIASMTVSFHPT